MYEHILLATDGSELATRALDHGLGLAKHHGARVTVVTVTDPWTAMDMAHEIRQGRTDAIKQFESLAADVAKRILDEAIRRGDALGISCERVHVEDRLPAEGIVATAKDKGCDLIVMASHGRRGAARALLGSQANEVLTRCTVPALVVR